MDENGVEQFSDDSESDDSEGNPKPGSKKALRLAELAEEEAEQAREAAKSSEERDAEEAAAVAERFNWKLPLEFEVRKTPHWAPLGHCKC